MVFSVTGKVALITGGTSGIGLSCAKELLRKYLRGVTLADINVENGRKAIQEITEEFGDGKAIFVETDVTKLKSFEDAFKKTVEQFKNIDILINNAGIVNEPAWEKSIAVNFTGVVTGMVLGIENYIPKHRSGSEGLIVNMASIAGVVPFAAVPVYTGTKFASVGITRAYGNREHYERTKVRVLAICPSFTDTPFVRDNEQKVMNSTCFNMFDQVLKKIPWQTPEAVALALVKTIEEAESGSAWVVEKNSEPYEYVLAPLQKPLTKL